eukprot:scaffold96354_cov33-Phaeocystis_antarctica.AAC.1
MRSENCLCVRAFISRELNSVFPVADCQSRAFGYSKPAGAINITPASETPDILRQKIAYLAVGSAENCSVSSVDFLMKLTAEPKNAPIFFGALGAELLHSRGA